jgi:hypothetical protein
VLTGLQPTCAVKVADAAKYFETDVGWSTESHCQSSTSLLNFCLAGKLSCKPAHSGNKEYAVRIALSHVLRHYAPLMMGQHWASAHKRGLKAMPARHSRELAVVAFLAIIFCVVWFQSKHPTPSGAALKRSSLRLSVTSPAAAKQQSQAFKALTCAEQAAASKPTDAEVKRLFGHKLRQLPATSSGSPVLAASNWEGLASKEHAGVYAQLFYSSNSAAMPTAQIIVVCCFSCHPMLSGTGCKCSGVTVHTAQLANPVV